MNKLISEYQFWLPLIISIATLFATLIFTFLNFRRARRIENENHIYKLKVDLYSKIFSEFVKLSNGLQDNISEARYYLENPTDETLDKLDDSADKVDDAHLAFNDFIISNSLIIPSKILKTLNKFSDQLLGIDPMDSPEEIKLATIDKLDKKLDGFIKDMDKIGLMLRADIHIDKINSLLSKRLK